MSQKVSTTKHYALFDIDSTSISGAITRHEYSKKGDLLYVRELFSVREYITNGEEYPFDHFFDQTLKTLKYVLDCVHLEVLFPLDGIYTNISVPWMSAQKRIIHYTRKKDFTCDQKLIDNLEQKGINESLYYNIDYRDHKVELIDQRTLEIYGNGYPLRRPLGKIMHDLELHSLTSVMSFKTKQKIEEIFEKVFHQLPTFISNTFVSYFATKSLIPELNNAIVLDVSGEVTEILIIENDRLRNIGSIPIGEYGMVRLLRDELKIPLKKASSLFSLYHNGDLELEYSKEIEPFLRRSFRVWFRMFYNVIDKYAKYGLLPHTIVLRADPRVYAWLGEFILSEDTLREHMHTKGRVELINMNHVDIEFDTWENPELLMLASCIDQYEKKI